MATTYYYFGASLPILEFNGKLPISTEEFLYDCERLLDKKDFELVRGLLNKEEISASNAIISKVYQFENDLHNEIAVYRAQKFNKEPLEYVRGEMSDNHEIAQLIKQAIDAPDPLEGEKIISQARWKMYDELSTGQYYTLAFILIYGLKLKIVERYHTIASPRGREIYEKLKIIDFPEEVVANV